ncbi:Hypothetical protein IALB_2143 [Ignavibacterium album JCM 16511]|uniref:Lipoprotein n=1 Tax=Ignavibacterium album (strain DSM 19864 / JCM 16511 / NBRC 101810 / Mat9-16) TaxID=945713 RepID=I0ALJ1_IGNAJ|nr:hypothetical protein [Ignavibacterium album]AFH49848.1 Hypothetical protein IALB_2143 [Ignavibacterium album JCM 16511]
MRIKLILIPLFLLLSCSDKSSQQLQTSPNNESVIKYYGYINRIFERDSLKFIEVDLVKILTGDSAIVEAKNLGKAEYEITNKGDTIWFDPNDYFIYNFKKDSLQFQLDVDCRIIIWLSDQTTDFKLTQRQVEDSDSLRYFLQPNKVFEIFFSRNKIDSLKEFWTP